MNVEMILGKTNFDAYSKVIEILKKRNKNETHVIITPDRNALNIEDSIMDLLGEDCLDDISVSTFTRFSNVLISQFDNEGNLKILSKPACVAIVKNILLKNYNELFYYKNSIEFNGFCSELYETICLFKSCNVNPSNIIETNNEFLNYKLHDIKLVYSEFEKFLQNNYTDSFNKLIKCSNLVKKLDLKNVNFYFVDFVDFNFQMYQIILSLIKKSKSVRIATVANVFDDLNNKNIYVNSIFYNMCDLCKQNGFNYKVFKCENNNSIINNLFSYNKLDDIKNNSKLDYNLQICDDINSEIDNLILKIKKLYINKKINSLNDINICVSDINKYKDKLSSAFSLSKIPYYLDCSSSVLDNCLVRYLNNLFEILSNKFDKDVVLEFLESPICNMEDNVFEYKNFINKFGIDYNALIDKSKLNKKISLTDGLNLIYKKFDIINCYKEKLQNDSKVLNIISLIKELLEKLDFDENINKLYLKLKENNEIINLRNLTKVYEKIKNSLKEIGEVFASEDISINNFAEIFKSYMEDLKLSQPPISINSIFIGDLNNSYFKKCDYLFILGANDSEFPTMSQDLGIINDSEISKLNEKNKISPTISLINKRKKFKVFELLNLANKLVNISFYESGGSVEKIAPAPFIDNLIKLKAFSIIETFKKSNIVKSLIQNDDNYFDLNLDYNICKKNFLYALKNWSSYESYVGFRNYLNYLYSVLKPFNSKELLNNLKYKNDYVRLDWNNNTMLNKNSISISQFETYFKCPYMHFIKYGLHLNDEETSEIQSFEFGNIIHDFLFNAVRLIINKDMNNAEISEIAKNVFEKTMNKEKYFYIYSNPLNKNYINALKEECERILFALYQQFQNSNYLPIDDCYEVPFSRFKNQITFNVLGKEIVLKGVIDRVDKCENDFRIVDYKTGADSFDDFTDLYNGKKIQLIVYLKVFADSHLDLKPAGAFYLPIKNTFIDGESENYKLSGIIKNNIENILNIDQNLKFPNYKSSIINLKTKKDCSFYENKTYKNLLLTDEQIKYITDFALSLMNRAVEEISKGKIDANPLENDNRKVCDYCKYKGICGFDKSFANKTKKVEYVENVSELENKVNGENKGD